MKCAVKWCGHSIQIALKHYLEATAEDFERAANQESSFAPKVAPELACIEENGAELLPRLLPVATAHAPAKGGKPNRDRGKPFGFSPPTSPCVRVRTRRFGWLSGRSDRE